MPYSDPRLGEVRTGAVGRVVMTRHALSVETTAFISLLRRLRMRVKHWMMTTQALANEESGNNSRSCGTMPDKDVVAVIDLYGKSLKWLLNEQRLRAALVKDDKGALALTAEEFDTALVSELRELAKSDPELADEILREAKAIDVPEET